MINSLSETICQDQRVLEVFCNCSSLNKFMYNDSFLKPVQNFKSDDNLSLSLNINCLMNVEVKQSHAIWETNFGKRLIYGSDFKQRQGLLEDGKAVRENASDLTDSRSDGLEKENKFLKKNSTVSKIGRGDATNKVPCRKFTAGKYFRTKRGKHKVPDWKKKNALENRMYDCDSISPKPSVFSTALTSTPSLNLAEGVESLTAHNSKETLQVLSSDEHPGLLASCVKKILDNVSDEYICEHCERSFSGADELTEHRREHEAEKENCLLCDKVFYRTDDFIRHLLTHEGVDRFSCKMCKKYFPTFKTFRDHHEKCHLIPLKTASQNDKELTLQWLPRYECVRCKADFSSKEMYKNHKRIHQQMDLTGAYLLCASDFYT